MCVTLNELLSRHLPSGVHRPSGVPTLVIQDIRRPNVLIYMVTFDFGFIIHFKDLNNRQLILQDSLLGNACHVEISRVYRFAKIIGYSEAGDHLVKFINICTLEQHSNYFSSQNLNPLLTLFSWKCIVSLKDFVNVYNFVQCTQNTAF